MSISRRTKAWRRILAVLLVLLSLLSITIPVAASTQLKPEPSNKVEQTDIALAYQTTIPNMLQAVEDFPEYLGLDPREVVDLSLSEPFTIPIYNNGVLVANEAILYFLVHSNEKYVATIALHKNDGEPGVFGKHESSQRGS